MVRFLRRFPVYAQFIKWEHTVFSFPILLGGAWLAGTPSLRLVLLILLAGTGARTAALALNRIIDRHVDRLNPRTANRELPSGAMTLKEGAGVAVTGLLVYGTAAWLIAPVCLWYAPIPVVVFVGYPFLKRWTPLAHLGVGLGLAMAPVGGWFAAAQRWGGAFPAFLLALFTLCWVAGFDIIYATLDEAADRAQGIQSLPARFGRPRALQISAGLHGLAFLALAALCVWRLQGVASFLLLVIAGLLLWWEHRTANDVEWAFFKINAALGFVVLGLVMIGR